MIIINLLSCLVYVFISTVTVNPNRQSLFKSCIYSFIIVLVYFLLINILRFVNQLLLKYKPNIYKDYYLLLLNKPL